MRKLILISAFVLASAAAQAGESRGLAVAANDQPQAATATQPAAPVATAQPEAAKADVKADVKADTAQPEAAKKQASEKQTSRPKKVYARHYEGDEAKARRIAARYGVYW